MEAVLELLVISAGVSHGLETSCDAREDGSQCYGALGGTVYLQLVTDATRYDALSFWKGSTGAKTEILKMKKDKWVIKDTPIEDRVHFFINNGTLRLNNTRRNDSGEYLQETFNSAGRLSGIRGLQLFIEAPVSSPQLSSECLSHGEMKVSCSSEGDGPQYSWTLDGQTQRDTRASSDNETNTITLKKGLSGNLTCTIRNYISSDSISKRISPCPEPGVSVFVYFQLAEVFILLTVCLGSYCFYKKETYHHKEATDMVTTCNATQNLSQCSVVLNGTLDV
ncbi:hepatocyte cell adhesion molecule isoform X2 [Oncorhynchus mykiss]|uniref:hepatocyte cell adhesion molecule isoform X2 n=1 Tax=Oncorhynchus mykiss TaxID=8022 RepID=UPI001878114A|nr:hepatocyte cell adhesion molecule isoform X2 [Oncorhynchus mykiss]